MLQAQLVPKQHDIRPMLYDYPVVVREVIPKDSFDIDVASRKEVKSCCCIGKGSSVMTSKFDSSVYQTGD